ncbi:hypothetical protein ACI4B7_27840, partial [Klebsiella pneumoniae]|uniref:hypothetical protein n=1 Tax=Klebsiella pneumoniae TaxID=573 RepID=UPI0038520B22
MSAPLPEMPKLAESNYKLFPEQTLDLEWAKAENSTSYEVELRNSANQVIDTKTVNQNSHQYKIPRVG